MCSLWKNIFELYNVTLLWNLKFEQIFCLFRVVWYWATSLITHLSSWGPDCQEQLSGCSNTTVSLVPLWFEHMVIISLLYSSTKGSCDPCCCSLPTPLLPTIKHAVICFVTDYLLMKLLYPLFWYSFQIGESHFIFDVALDFHLEVYLIFCI